MNWNRRSGNVLASGACVVFICITQVRGDACCLPDASCILATNSTTCRAESGEYQSGTASCAPNPCEPFPSSGVNLLSWVPKSAFPDALNHTQPANDCWGYVSPSGREYALIGLWSGTGFVEVTDPSNPMVVGYIDGPNSTWRDMKTLDEYAYIVSQEGDGLQIVDLSQIDSAVVTEVTTTTIGNQFFESHNIALNVETEFAYGMLSEIPGLVAIDLSNRENPQIAGNWSLPGVRVHDVQVVSYPCGPYAGLEIAFCCTEDDGFHVVDVTDKQNMFLLSSSSYPNVQYSHQGWLTDDRKYFLLGDELDELNSASVDFTTTHVFDVQDLDNVQWIGSFTSSLQTINHNMIVLGDRVFQANYEGGLCVFDISDIENVNVLEVGFYDTYPERDFRDFSFSGAWAPYPLLPSRNVLVSDRQRGLFILDATLISSSAAAPRLELIPRGGSGPEIIIDPGDVVVLDVMVSGWSGETLQGVKAQLEAATLVGDCGGTLSLFDSDGDNDNECDPGLDAFCPTCPGQIAAGAFEGIYVDDCRADHFSQIPPPLTAGVVDVDTGLLSLEWTASSGGSTDPGDTRYVGSFVLEASNDFFGSAQIKLECDPGSTAQDGSGGAFSSPLILVGAVVSSTTPNVYGDLDQNGTINLFDLFCVVDGFGDVFDDCSFADVDIQPCGGNGTLNLQDLFALLDAFSDNLACCQAPL